MGAREQPLGPTAPPRARALPPRALATGRAGRALAAALFFFSGLRQIAFAFRRQGASARRAHALSPARQFRGLLHVVFRRNAAPQAYYTHRLFRPADLRRADSFFEHRETQLLLTALYTSLDTAALADKLRFQDFCSTHDLPTPPLWAVFRDGALDPARSAAWLAQPRGDFFVKPTTDFAGHGIARWCHDPATGRYTDGTRSLAHSDLTAAFAAASAGDKALLLQPRLLEGGALRELAGDGVCNFRILTACPPGGPPSVLTAVLRLPNPGHHLTEIFGEVFAAPVDLDSGTLGPAHSKDLGRGTHARHPATGALIGGRRIASWPAVAALALRAHAACPWMPFVGWDIVDTADGPTLLEANAYWGANLCQMAGHRFLGETAFPEIYLAHLARLRPDLLPHAA